MSTVGLYLPYNSCCPVQREHHSQQLLGKEDLGSQRKSKGLDKSFIFYTKRSSLVHFLSNFEERELLAILHSPEYSTNTTQTYRIHSMETLCLRWVQEFTILQDMAVRVGGCWMTLAKLVY